MPIWLNHILASVFLHQDQAFLHHQEKILHDRGYSSTSSEKHNDRSYADVVFTPNPQDKMLLTFRNWLRTRAGGIPFKNGRLPPREHDHRRLYDVWNAHTKHCRICLDALRNIKRVRFISSILAAAALSLLKNKLHAILGTALFATVALGAHKLINMFYVYEFSHADND